MSALGPTLQAFFTDRLIRERHASPETIASYRDAWRRLLAFASRHTGKKPSALDMADIDAQLVSAFLDHLEAERANSVSTRNARLSAIHSLFRYAAFRHPEHAATIQRVLAMPAKRCERAQTGYERGGAVAELHAEAETASVLVGHAGLEVQRVIGMRDQ